MAQYILFKVGLFSLSLSLSGQRGSMKLCLIFHKTGCNRDNNARVFKLYSLELCSALEALQHFPNEKIRNGGLLVQMIMDF